MKNHDERSAFEKNFPVLGTVAVLAGVVVIVWMIVKLVNLS